MLISLNWIRDFVDLPADIDPRALAERFTVTTAEVEGIEHVTADATGLVAAEVRSVEPVAGAEGLSHVVLDAGRGEVHTATHARDLTAGARVVYAPPGARVGGAEVGTKRVEAAGIESVGAIVSGAQLGLAGIGERAILLPPTTKPGEAIDTKLFDDWIIEVDNKSITHRPDLWGHYGIARELAAMYGRPLRAYETVPLEELTTGQLPVPIVIDDPAKCPRYSCLRFTGVKAQPAPLWMQVRLAHVGLRPIDILVDLTNYIMVELGQPMHAFDGAGIDRIEVATAAAGEKFTTLDGVQRTMPPGALMIQSNRRSIAIAGVMGGADTEINPRTTDLLLESANFEPATIRRCAAAMGHRTDASARFEKSLDPVNTVLAIRRFVHLARPELPGMKLTSRLSDAWPQPPAPTVIRVDPAFVSRYVGRTVTADEIERLLTPLEFGIRRDGQLLDVTVPSYRATKDVTMEADVVEEIARIIGYGSIEPRLPTVTVRYAPPDAAGSLERRALELLCGGMSYAEVHRYIWFEDNWLATLGYDPGPTVRLRNPAAAGQERLRTTLVPGLLASADLNRRHIDRFELVEIGSVFATGSAENVEHAQRRHIALVLAAPGRKSQHEDELLRRLKTDLTTFVRQLWNRAVSFTEAAPAAPWEHESRTAGIVIDGQTCGRLTSVPAALRRRIDEHLVATAIVVAELDLTALVALTVDERKLAPVPAHPQIELDFSVLTPAERRYSDIERQLAQYDHPLLRRLAFVDAFEGGSVPVGQRSLTFRAAIGDPTRTLTEADIQDFRSSFLAHLAAGGLTLRG